jgi:hypothetical protein
LLRLTVIFVQIWAFWVSPTATVPSAGLGAAGKQPARRRARDLAAVGDNAIISILLGTCAISGAPK